MTRPYSDLLKSQAGRTNRTQGRLLTVVSALAISIAVLPAASVSAQDPPKADAKVINGYAIHQSIELGGHISDHSGSGAMWDTLVNLQSGPRILSHSLAMHSIDPSKTPFFDELSTNSFGYGGDPYDGTMLRLSKGRLYQLDGNFRRDRQYFDYDLLDNPLTSPTAFPFVQQFKSPHLFNTVRRMSDVDLTILPLSTISVRFGYSKNTMEGPTFSSVHSATDALLSQWWRNSTDSYTGGVDWKPTRQTTFSYDQFVTTYKGDTSWRLTGLNYQLANGTPVSLGIDIFTGPAVTSTCVVAGTGNNAVPTVRPNCAGTLSYSRSAPTRTLFPTEQVRFASSELKHVTMNGHVLYSGATGNVNQYNEFFTGWLSRTFQRQITDTGSGNNGKFASLKRISVAADYGVTVEITPEISISDVFDFNAFRNPASNQYNEASLFSTSLSSAQPATNAYGTSTTPDLTANTNSNFLGQNIKSNTIQAAWDPTQSFKVSLGYRYRDREITYSPSGTVISTFNTGRTGAVAASTCPNRLTGCTVEVDTPADPETTSIHEHWALFGVFLQPIPNLRLNGNVDLMYADNTFTEISPRQVQHYKLRAGYKATPWLRLSGTVNDFESRNNVSLIHHLEHSRDYSFGTSISKSEKWAVDMNYAYDDVFSRTDECYTVISVPALGYVIPAGLPPCNDPDKVTNNALPFLGSGYYDQPTQFGSISIMLAPVKRIHANLGYRMSAVDGHELRLNPRQALGSLQSQYQMPYGDLAFNLAPGWQWKAAWNYYGYGEGSPTGPTAPRSFRGNVYTLGVKYAF